MQKARSERFWERVDTSDQDGCWPWLGAVNHKRGGYGAFYDDDTRLRRAHRVAYELANAYAPLAHEMVMHTCDKPPCCNPAHLMLGTQMDNITDMRQKKRHAPPVVENGSQRYNAVLTETMVRAARTRHANGEGVTALAAEFGVNRQTLGNAVWRLSWKHVD